MKNTQVCKLLFFVSMLYSISSFSQIPKAFLTQNLLSNPAHMNFSQAHRLGDTTQTISIDTSATISTENQNLYAKVASISFWSGTTNGACSGTERTLDLSGNTWWKTGLTVGGSGARSIGSLVVHTEGIDAAATSLGYTLTNSNCIEVEIDYKNGSSIAVGSTEIDMDDSGTVNPKLVLGSITVSGSSITGSTAAENDLDLVANGDIQFSVSNTEKSHLALTSGTSTTVTIKNIGYGSLSNLSVSAPSLFSAQFSNNTCGATLSSNATCSIDYSGSSLSGANALTATATGASSGSAILPFVIHKADSIACWGSQNSGALGNGQTSGFSAVPTTVSNLSSNISQVAVGSFNSCALKSDGGVECWGNNGSGQLGDNSTTQSATPVTVDIDESNTALSGVTALSDRLSHVCALINDGSVKCWGLNNKGQLGDDSTTNRDTAVNVKNAANTGNLSNIVQVAVSSYSTCALNNVGAVQCWGENTNGELGDGTNTDSDIPVYVSGLTSGVTSIAAGFKFTCALLNDGTVKCWGLNTYGQLGDNNGKSNQNTPVSGNGLTDVVQIAAGGRHACALISDGTVKCWGGNGDGQLGDNSTTERASPVQVRNASDTGNLSNVTSITAGFYYTCATINDGALYCWGGNSGRQLGNNTTSDSSLPVSVKAVDDSGNDFSNSVMVTGGDWNTCAIYRAS